MYSHALGRGERPGFPRTSAVVNGETLTDCGFPSEHWTKIRTNNTMGRQGQGKRRTAALDPLRPAC